MSKHSLQFSLAALSVAALFSLAAPALPGADETARRRVAAIAAKSSAAQPTSVASSAVRVARPLVPKAVSDRIRLIGMDAETIPGYCIYTYAQGAKTWCVTNELKAIDFKAVKNRYSKLRIVTAAKAAGKWDALKAGIVAADLEDEWAACQYIEDGDPAFVSATNAVVAAGIATDEEIAAFLKTAIDN